MNTLLPEDNDSPITFIDEMPAAAARVRKFPPPYPASQAPAFGSMLGSIVGGPAPSALQGAGVPRAVVGFIALGFGIAVSLLLGVLSPETSSIGKMFSPKRIESVIPALILTMFVWGLIACFLRRRRLGAMSQICQPSLLPLVTRHVREIGIAQTAASLDGPRTQASPLLRRIRSVLDQWQTHPGLQEADVVLQQHVDHDDEAVHAGYSLVRMFVWALPVLGLIGTVIGISLAVGGFASFLSGTIDDVGEIKKNLVNVTGGLSFAFLITLEGLATSLVLMFVASALQGRERALLSSVQKQITGQLLPVLREVAPATTADGRGERSPAEIEVYTQHLAEASRVVLDVVQASATRMLEGLGASLTAQRKQIDDWSHGFAEGLRAAAAQLGGTTEKSFAAIAQASQKFNEQSESLHTMISGQREMFEEMLISHGTGAAKLQQELSAAIERQATFITGCGDTLAQLAQATQTVADSHKTAVATFNSVDFTAATRGIETLAGGLMAQTGQLAEFVKTLASLSQGTDNVMVSHQALLEATRQLEQAGLGRSLETVSKSLNSLGPVLQAFQKPFVLRAMPAEA